MNFFNQITTIAEAEGHHPDLFLANYNEAAVEVTTHSVKGLFPFRSRAKVVHLLSQIGLTENDFILAAKIDQLTPKLKQTKSSIVKPNADHRMSSESKNTNNLKGEHDGTKYWLDKNGDAFCERHVGQHPVKCAQ
jgi:pterin-4a-carbinolamine dehydratase